MPYQKSYIKQEWKNLPEEETPISPAALLHIEEGISELDDRIVEIGNQEEKDPTVPEYVKNIKVRDIDNWNSKSEFSGYYGDLKEKPIIPQADGTTIKMSAYGVLSVGGNSEGAHTEGYNTTASGEFSHAEGIFATAGASGSHAEGLRTIASGEAQHVQGKYSVEDANGIYAHIVGGGTKEDDRKNIYTLDWADY